MGKILPKRKYFRSSIYRPNLDVGSHIDNVRYSLEHLIFSNTKESESNLLKKRIVVVLSMTILLMVVSSFFSPKGKAEIATFYPTSCLGGWNSPRNAEGETQITSNTNEYEFSESNSAILPSTMNADIYCGSFVGEIAKNTKPTKMLVSLSWSKGAVVSHEKNITGDFASSSQETVSTSSTTDVSLATVASSSLLGLSTSTAPQASTTQNGEDVVIATSTEKVLEGASFVENIVTGISDAFKSIFGSDKASSTQESNAQVISPSQESTTTVPTTIIEPQNSKPDEVIPQTVPAATEPTPTPVQNTETSPVQSTETPIEPSVQAPAEPTSFLDTLIEKIANSFISKVLAENVDNLNQTSEVSTSTETSNPIVVEVLEKKQDVIVLSTSTNEIASSADILALDSLNGTTTEEKSLVSATTSETLSQGDFLEVLYTFDGVTWASLGTVNEASMKYRTFEIPVTASTSWADMGQLQIKVQPISQVDAKPTVYLDGIKVEVLYESTLAHEHPDFVRDTILQDEVVGNIRIVRIINNDTNLEEIWYFHHDSLATSTSATSTLSVSTSTEMASSSSQYEEKNTTYSSTTENYSTSSSTDTVSTTSERIIRPDSFKNKWIKLDNGETASKDVSEIIKDIEKQEKKQEFIIPDFTKDFIKKIQGSFLSAIVVQIEQEGMQSLWLFNVEKDTQEKVDTLGKTTFSKSYPLGMKDDTVFWLSEDQSTVFSYNVITKMIDQKKIPPYDISLGERGVVFFDSIPWKVIVGTDRFSFYSDATGEIFSDENLTIQEAFRVKEKLDTILPQEKLEELNFVTDATTTEE